MEELSQELSPELLSTILESYLNNFTWFKISQLVYNDDTNGCILTDLFALTLVSKCVSSEFHRWANINWYLPLEQKSMFDCTKGQVIDYFMKMLRHNRIVIEDDGRAGDYEWAVNVEYRLDDLNDTMIIECSEYKYNTPSRVDLSYLEIYIDENTLNHQITIRNPASNISVEGVLHALNIPIWTDIPNMMRFDHVWFKGISSDCYYLPVAPGGGA